MTLDLDEEFPVRRHWVYLNHAHVAPLCRRAKERIDRLTLDLSLNGDTNLDTWFDLLEEGRRQAATLLNASPDEVAFMKNTSEALSTVAEGLPWRPGDNVVCATKDFPSNVYPWQNLARKGVEVRRVNLEEAEDALLALRGAISDRTRLVAVSFVHWSSGARLDLGALSDECHRQGAQLCVDAVQGLGALPLDVKSTHIDYLAANSHKWLLSTWGAAILYMRREHISELQPGSVGWHSVKSSWDFERTDFDLCDTAQRFECGSPILASIAGLSGSLSLILECGLDEIASRIRSVTDHLVERLSALGAHVASDRNEGRWSGIVSFTLPHVESVRVVQHCREQGIVVSCREGRVRVSPHFWNSPDDIDQFIQVAGRRT